jgi:hypothetical protein
MAHYVTAEEFALLKKLVEKQRLAAAETMEQHDLPPLARESLELLWQQLQSLYGKLCKGQRTEARPARVSVVWGCPRCNRLRPYTVDVRTADGVEAGNIPPWCESCAAECDPASTADRLGRDPFPLPSSAKLQHVYRVTHAAGGVGWLVLDSVHEATSLWRLRAALATRCIGLARLTDDEAQDYVKNLQSGGL